MKYRPASATAAPPMIKLPQEVDATNCGRVASELTAACVPGVAVVIADLTDTTFCDSSALRVLIQVHKLAAVRGIEFDVAVNSPAVLRVMELAGLKSVLRLYPSVEAAVNAYRQDLA